MSEVEKVEHRIIIKENWLFCVLSKEGRAQNTYKREMLPCLWGAVPFHKYSVFYFLYLEHRKTKLFVTKIETVFFYNLFVVYLLRRFEKIITKYFFCYLDVYSLKIFDLSIFQRHLSIVFLLVTTISFRSRNFHRLPILRRCQCFISNDHFCSLFQYDSSWQ